jgi:hypothetical protein
MGQRTGHPPHITPLPRRAFLVSAALPALLSGQCRTYHDHLERRDAGGDSATG